VIGREQVAISVATPRLPANPEPSTRLGAAETAAPVSIATNTTPSVSPKAE
jgi:hypothetical protein